MKTKNLAVKTAPFLLAKALIGLLSVVVPAAFLLIFIGLGWLFGENGARCASILWLPFGAALHAVLLCIPGRLLEIGHLTAAEEIVLLRKPVHLQLFRSTRKALNRFSSAEERIDFDKTLSSAIRQLYERRGEKLIFFRSRFFSPVNRLLTFSYLRCVRHYCLCRSVCCKSSGPNDGAVQAIREWMNRQPASAPEAARIVLKFSVWELMLILLFSILLGAFFVRIGFYPWTALPLILLCVSALNFAVADSFSQLYLLSLCTAKKDFGQPDAVSLQKLTSASESFSRLVVGTEENKDPSA